MLFTLGFAGVIIVIAVYSEKLITIEQAIIIIIFLAFIIQIGLK